jgi:hypothetical protein
MCQAREEPVKGSTNTDETNWYGLRQLRVIHAEIGGAKTHRTLSKKEKIGVQVIFFLFSFVSKLCPIRTYVKVLGYKY